MSLASHTRPVTLVVVVPRHTSFLDVGPCLRSFLKSIPLPFNHTFGGTTTWNLLSGFFLVITYIVTHRMIRGLFVFLCWIHYIWYRLSFEKNNEEAAFEVFDVLKLEQTQFRAMLARHKEQGRDKVFLRTEAFRHGAIRLYRSLGFVPWPRDDEEKQQWAKVEAAMDASSGDGGEERSQ